MTHVTCRLTAKNRDQLRNPTLGNRVWATFTFLHTCLCFSKIQFGFTFLVPAHLGCPGQRAVKCVYVLLKLSLKVSDIAYRHTLFAIRWVTTCCYFYDIVLAHAYAASLLSKYVSWNVCITPPESQKRRGGDSDCCVSNCPKI